jgi:hypothetical protein
VLECRVGESLIVDVTAGGEGKISFKLPGSDHTDPGHYDGR